MTKEQEVIYEEYADLAEWLACKHACVEADYMSLQKEAERSLKRAIENYNKSVHGEFEEFATFVIERDLDSYVHSNGNSVFSVGRTAKEEAEEEEEEEGSALEFAINRILRDAGFEEDKGLGKDEFIFS